MAQVDLVLARAVLVERVLDRDAHRLERLDGALAQVAGDVGGGEVEVGAVVEDLQRLRGIALLEVEELHLGRHVEREAPLAGPVEVAPQHLAGVALERRAVEVDDVAEHPGVGGRRDRPTGSSSKLLGSGRASTSLSCTREKPSMDEPSKVMPSSRAFSSSAGVMAKDFSWPRTSVNQSRMKPDTALLHRPQHVVLLAFHAGLVSLAGRLGIEPEGRVHRPFTNGQRPGNGHPQSFRPHQLTR